MSLSTSGLSYGRPDDIFFLLRDLTDEVIDGVTWKTLKLANPLNTSNDNITDVYIGVNKFAGEFQGNQFGVVLFHCYELQDPNPGDVIDNYVTYFYNNPTRVFTTSNNIRTSFYKLKRQQFIDKLHFRWSTGLINGTDITLVPSNIACFLEISLSSLEENKRPGHQKGTKRLISGIS